MERQKEVPEKKKEITNESISLIKESNSVMLVSIKNLPASQFQAIKKKLRDKAVIKVIKKSIMERAIGNIEKGAIKNLKKYLREDIAFIFSKIEPFELSAILSKNKTKAKAKTGQIAEEDVIVEPGLTELVPGPVISELSGLGIKFAIEDGKISIKERKVILKEGEKVSELQASIMVKLDIKPISVGLEPLVVYDAKEDKIYENIRVDTEKLLSELKTAFGGALAFAVKIVYPCKETIKYLLAKADAEEKALEKFIKPAEEKEQVQIKQENIQGG